MKRMFDIFAATVMLVLLAPVLLLVALLVRLLLGRPVLFCQVRPGLHGRPFRLVKFRTMRPQSPGHTLPDAARLTRFGRLLRASSLDELPELWNVLKGEMSLVGPRPLLMEYLPLYDARQRRRHEVRPGITGWAQVNGRNNIPWSRKFELDVWYVDHRSLLLDLKILGRTLATTLARDGIEKAGHATTDKFTGNENA